MRGWLYGWFCWFDWFIVLLIIAFEKKLEHKSEVIKMRKVKQILGTSMLRRLVRFVWWARKFDWDMLGGICVCVCTFHSPSWIIVPSLWRNTPCPCCFPATHSPEYSCALQKGFEHRGARKAVIRGVRIREVREVRYYRVALQSTNTGVFLGMIVSQS